MLIIYIRVIEIIGNVSYDDKSKSMMPLKKTIFYSTKKLLMRKALYFFDLLISSIGRPWCRTAKKW